MCTKEADSLENFDEGEFSFDLGVSSDSDCSNWGKSILNDCCCTGGT